MFWLRQRVSIHTGAAAALCTEHQTTPRGVYEKHVWELQQMVIGLGEHAGVLVPDSKQETKKLPREKE